MFGIFKKLADATSNYGDDVIAHMKKIVRTGKMSLDCEAPFPFKWKNEFFICSIPATLGVYKRDGGIGYGALTTRVRLAKGIYLRGGAGKVGMSKSVVFDQPGVLHVTTHRIVFNGQNTNSSTPWSKVIDTTLDHSGSHLQIDRESGKDWYFQIDEKPSIVKMAEVLTFGRHAVKLSDLPIRKTEETVNPWAA